MMTFRKNSCVDLFWGMMGGSVIFMKLVVYPPQKINMEPKKWWFPSSEPHYSSGFPPRFQVNHVKLLEVLPVY